MCDHFALVDQHQELTNKRAEEESSVSELGHLEECVRGAENDSEALREAHTPVDGLNVERGLLTAGTDQANADRDTFAARFLERDVPSPTRKRELGAGRLAVRSSKIEVAAGEDKANTAEARAYDTLDEMSELWLLVNRRNGTICCERERTAGPVNAELVHAWPGISAALSDSEGMFSSAICEYVMASMSRCLLRRPLRL